jgi:septum formation protein
MGLILASASPRRAEILRDAGMRFDVVPTDVKEARRRGENVRALTRRLAAAKASAAADKVLSGLKESSPPVIVIGADTMVEIRGRLLGKPGSTRSARRMLRQLSGRTHRVVTSIAAIRLPDRAEEVATQSTRVRFARLNQKEIDHYVATGEPLDKAGAYAVQGIGGRFIERIEGCYFNVVGLPMARLYRMLRDLGWQSTAAAPKGGNNQAAG